VTPEISKNHRKKIREAGWKVIEVPKIMNPGVGVINRCSDTLFKSGN